MYSRFGVTSVMACSTDLSSSWVPHPLTSRTEFGFDSYIPPHVFAIPWPPQPSTFFQSIFHVSTSNMLQHIEISFFGLRLHMDGAPCALALLYSRYSSSRVDVYRVVEFRYAEKRKQIVWSSVLRNGSSYDLIIWWGWSLRILILERLPGEEIHALVLDHF